MLQSKILSTIEAAYGFHALSGSPLFRYASRASNVIFVLGAIEKAMSISYLIKTFRVENRYNYRFQSDWYKIYPLVKHLSNFVAISNNQVACCSEAQASKKKDLLNLYSSKSLCNY